MLKEFKNFISQNSLFNPEDKILLAISGGVDSMVMAYLFHQCTYRFAVAHCNFKLRGEASDADEELVRSMAKKYEVKFFARQFETEQIAKDRGVSIQMAARDLRYEWFDELLDDFQFSYLATAHHLNDALETTLFNLAKGTGIAGLKGIPPKSQNRIRPMLFAEKKTIESFAGEKKITWREDQSNASVKYHRNLLRHKVIPLLEKINPDVIRGFSISSRKVAAAENVLKANIGALNERLLKKSGQDFLIGKEDLLKQLEGAFVLSEILKPFGFNYSQACDIYDKLSGVGKKFLSERYQLNIDREELIISPILLSPAPDTILIESTHDTITGQGFQLKIQQVSAADFVIPTDRNTAALDMGKLNFPLQLRPWQDGDWFVPLGMRHKKKLSDFMIDEKIPLNLKKRVFVVKSAEDIVWIIGHRIDDRYKITARSRQVFIIKKEAHD
ncbi:tRNA lysidine(34) synthetase TilS [Fulvivirgaceae bacterium BMA12]|uniref:tRNA(Ile)-lysidine synthase n=1 Tax=Agaribacillus aureus TaxID=3051825 RepID=A0ABT8L327_9BACT|nr:tRNA lysidine(34) synthetase TilS [Fulvivirgaceae bacterium BMA12]